MKIALGCDHGGFPLKKEIIKYLESNGFEYIDYGCYDENSVDYPVFAKKVADAVLAKECDYGMLFCGTGIGISIAANKIHGIRCGLCSDVYSAKKTKEHNDANILAMGARVIGPGLAVEIADAFLKTDYSKLEKHQRRLDLITQIENEQ
ncbi:MAG: ribose 5-phosphate isomerase B [Eubacteriales bacterium]